MLCCLTACLPLDLTLDNMTNYIVFHKDSNVLSKIMSGGLRFILQLKSFCSYLKVLEVEFILMFYAEFNYFIYYTILTEYQSYPKISFMPLC